MKDDEFTPKLGRQRSKDAKQTLKYGSRIVAATRLAGSTTGMVARRFDGSRIGRGASMGRLLSSRDRLAGFRARRAIVKTRLIRLSAKGMGSVKAHLRYIQRDGVTREGAPGELYGPDTDTADGRAFLEKSGGDRHQFRFIVSAEDGSEYHDLKPYVRRLMTQMEADLGTRLDWVAVDHFNTAHPHTHIMLRGVDDTSQNLVIAREYISHAIRARAAELVTLDLGPRTDQEIEARLRHDIGEERMTAIDRRLLHRMDAARDVSPADNDPFHQAVATGRLRKLEAMGLAEPQGERRWRLADGLEDTLRRMGERGDIIRTMQRELTARRLDRAGVEQVIDGEVRAPIVGRLIHRGLSDELRDRHYIMIDGVDGRVHHVDIGHGDATEPLVEGATIRISTRISGVRTVDHTIGEIAAGNDGRYSVDLHLRHDPNASEAFAETHVRRLETLRRGRTGIKREADGSWRIPADHLDRVAAFEVWQLRDRPIEVETISTVSVDRLATREAATWLDRNAASSDPLSIRDAGYGAEVRAAITRRQAWLVEQELADVDPAGRVRLRANALMVLQRRELAGAGQALRRELGKSYVAAEEGQRIEGRIARRIDLQSGRFALIEKSQEFTLVPWEGALDRQLGKSGSGILRMAGVNWQFGRGRSGPTIS